MLTILLACNSPEGRKDAVKGPDDTATVVVDSSDTSLDDTGESLVDTGPRGWIGSACDTTSDCEYDGAECLTEDYPNGMCSLDCELYCPDEDGFPVTFCSDELDLGSGGGCVSRCDYDLFPEDGCRPGYGCVVSARANEPSTETYVCLPGRESEVGGDCLDELSKRGVGFTPTTHTVEHPSGYPNLDCIIEDPVYLKSPLHGVELQYYDGNETSTVLMSCEGALAVSKTVEDVKPLGVTAMRHIGTYNCRTISGSSSLSRHAYGDAIDIYGFEFNNGKLWTLIDHWEHDTSNPSSNAGSFLYDAAYRWHDDRVWNIILTPNYNSAHDNHFHVDMTPDTDYIGATDGFYIGPNNGH
jgi:hypothetical protein